MNIQFELYKKCIKGECTPEEASLVEGWLKGDPKAFEAEMLAEIMQMGRDKEMPSALRQEMLDHFRQKGVSLQAIPVQAIPEEEPVVEMYPAGKRRNVRSWIRWTVAAASVIIIVAGWRYLSNKTASPPVAWETIFNNGSEAKQVTLPDSSKVWLNAYTRIRYRENFNGQAVREVELTGEAYFKVQSLADRAFIVLTGNVQTQVLGTEFNVEAYVDESMIRVSLQEGKVRVNCANMDSSQAKILLPGQMATYQKGSTLLSVGKTVSDMPQLWIKEGLALNDIPLRDALQRIGRKYDRKIIFDTTGAGRYRHIKAYYRAISIDQVLLQLGFACDFDFKKDDSVYKISFKQKHPVR